MSNSNESWDGKDKFGGGVFMLDYSIFIIAFLIIILYDCSR